MAEQMDVALEENAEAYELRGPNSNVTLFALVSLFGGREDCSNVNPEGSNVSRSNHSSFCVSGSEREEEEG